MIVFTLRSKFAHCAAGMLVITPVSSCGVKIDKQTQINKLKKKSNKAPAQEHYTSMESCIIFSGIHLNLMSHEI